MSDWNAGIIAEFRTNAGIVGGRFEGVPILLLHHRGAKTGVERVNPLAYRELENGSLAIFASKGGSRTNPDWFHNVRTNPEVTVEVGTETRSAIARVAAGEERTRIWEEQKRLMPAFAEYEKRTPREIPVVILEPAG